VISELQLEFDLMDVHAMLPSSPAHGAKRKRAARACEACRAKKYRCDELYPCSKCSKYKVDCVYEVSDAARQRLFPSGSPTDQRPLQARSIQKESHTSIPGAGIGPPRQLIEQSKDLPGSENQQGEDGQDDEISSVNAHTQNPEFHGKTSSLAFLAALRPEGAGSTPRTNSGVPESASQPSLVYNEGFSPEALTHVQHQEIKLLERERYHFSQAHIFLEGYFQNLHFIHPILNRQHFMSRCEDLWFGRSERQAKGFVALYYSVMSLGALIRTWDEPEIAGLSRLDWSRRLFNLARVALESLKDKVSIEFVQCLFIMAKVCQNELNPSLAYFYLGWAVRASFSAGFNRRRCVTEGMTPQDETTSLLFWGLYSLEVETCFALGRPDSLGSDAYHNQPMPTAEDAETAILTVMVRLARIIRDVSESIYLPDVGLDIKLERAKRIEIRMISWLQDLPATIRPPILSNKGLQVIAKDPLWAKRQRLVLETRFYNVKMVLFRPFLASALKGRAYHPPEMQQAIDKCVEAATCTIELMHNMFCHNVFFRTWWYNTTYVLYATAIILCYGTRVAPRDETGKYLELGRKAIEILEAMSESVVARNSANLVKQIIAAATSSERPEASQQEHNNLVSRAYPADSGPLEVDQFSHEALTSFLDLDLDLDFLGINFPLNGELLSIWNDPALPL
jgi:Fungal specific transcription factor domain/Fungal Zn(2)-Cys(6) binuclear cluster domain